MNMQLAKWCIDVTMAIVFIICFITGLFKFTVLMRMLGLTGLVFPLALMSDIHDWSGVVLGLLVAIHLIINRRWIITVTKKILAGAANSSQSRK